MSIYVAAHKEFKAPRNSFYKPIQVGNGKPLGILRDDVGDNIALKNESFCELTALYWAWKNDRDSSILGLCHYRRYFASGQRVGLRDSLLSEQNAKNYLKAADIILPEQWHWDMTVEQYYSHCSGIAKDFERARQVIAERYPAYLRAFELVAKGNSASYCNMMVAHRETVRAYCEWLFDILFELEPQINLAGRSPSEVRVFGYLGEILLNVWVVANGLTVVEAPIIRTDISQKSPLRSAVKKLVRFAKR